MRRELRIALSFGLLVAVAPALALGQEAKDQKSRPIMPAEVNLGRPVDFERDVYAILDAK